MIYTPENTHGRNVEVRVDDKKINHVFYADTDKGFIKKYIHPTSVVGDEIESEIIYGDVKVLVWGKLK